MVPTSAASERSCLSGAIYASKYSTIAYAPFAFFCWLSPIVTLIYGYMGWTITKLDPDREVAVPVAADESVNAETWLVIRTL